MADETYLSRLKRSVKEWNQWVWEQPNLWPDLTSADLAGLSLCGVDLLFANLEAADLQGCDLTFANLDCANLREAKLAGANLRGATLWRADLSGANLCKGNCSAANLEGVIFKKTRLTGATFNHTHVSDLLMAQVDLRSVVGLETVIHDGPSAVDLNSVMLPIEPQTRLHFLRGVGFSDALINALPPLLPSLIEAPRYFVSYADHDEAFVRRLSEDLQAHGIRCWLLSHDDVNRVTGGGLQPRERLVLVLSEHTLSCSWAHIEVHFTLKDELEQGCPVLFPLRLDASVLQTEQAWAVRLREGRAIDDFTNWQDDAAYQQAFAALLLKIDRPATG